jgi:peroxiredoxin
MPAATSTMLPLGTAAPDFRLTDFEGKSVALGDLKNANGLVVAFICSHCPFVRHIRSGFSQFAREYQARGIKVVAIASNDTKAFPQDGAEGMRNEARDANYSFPYLLDESQAVAKAYRAACTPDFYLFDRDSHLVYRGQFDDSRPSNGLAVTGKDLRAACDALLDGRKPTADQKPSIGCNIKWKVGNEPEYAR